MAGSQVSRNSVIYECNPYPYSIYCTIPAFQPQWGSLWTDAWSEVSKCKTTESPSSSPSDVPSTQEPSKQPSTSPSSSPTARPTLVSYDWYEYERLCFTPYLIVHAVHSLCNQSPSDSPTVSPSVRPTDVSVSIYLCRFVYFMHLSHTQFFHFQSKDSLKRTYNISSSEAYRISGNRRL